MARIKRENADYFSHDADMRNDPRIKAIRNKFGLNGYAIWCMLLEVFTDSDFFRREIDALEIELLSADFGISSGEFKEMLEYMVQVKLLHQFGNCGYLSQKLIERLQSVTDKREKERNRRHAVTEIPQSKVKQTKANKSKVDIIDSDFELLFVEYGSHGVKTTAFNYWKKLNEKDKEIVKRNIPKYLAYLETEPWRKKKNFEGWLNPKNRLFEAEYDTGEKPYTPLSQEYIDRLEDECDQDEYKTIGEHVKALEAKGEFDND